MELCVTSSAKDGIIAYNWHCAEKMWNICTQGVGILSNSIASWWNAQPGFQNLVKSETTWYKKAWNETKFWWNFMIFSSVWKYFFPHDIIFTFFDIEFGNTVSIVCLLTGVITDWLALRRHYRLIRLLLKCMFVFIWSRFCVALKPGFRLALDLSSYTRKTTTAGSLAIRWFAFILCIQRSWTPKNLCMDPWGSMNSRLRTTGLYGPFSQLFRSIIPIRLPTANAAYSVLLSWIILWSG